MKSTKNKILFDAVYITILVVCVAIAFFCIPTFTGDSAEAANEPTTSATTEETIEPIQEPTEEPTETEPLTTEDTQPPETVVPVVLYDVPLDKELQLHIIEQAEAHGIDPAIIMAMAFRESTYRTDAIGDGGNSYGLLQIQPRWHYARMDKLGCTDLLDPYQNVAVGIDYLCELLNRYGSIEAALTAYNQGHYNGTVTNYAKTVVAKAEELAVTL